MARSRFNRSHYEDVLVVRVENLVPEGGLVATLCADQRLRGGARRGRHARRQAVPAHQPRRAEAALPGAPAGAFQAMEVRPGGPRQARARWDDYRLAFEAAISRCSTEGAPWYVIPADRKGSATSRSRRCCGRNWNGCRCAGRSRNSTRRRSASSSGPPPGLRDPTIARTSRGPRRSSARGARSVGNVPGRAGRVRMRQRQRLAGTLRADAADDRVAEAVVGDQQVATYHLGAIAHRAQAEADGDLAVRRQQSAAVVAPTAGSPRRRSTTGSARWSRGRGASHC